MTTTPATTLTITFQGMEPSPVLRHEIERRFAKLERLAVPVLTCNVTVRQQEQRHLQGNRYAVHAHLTVPGATIEAGKTPRADHTHEDPFLALRDTFDAVRRQLDEHLRIRRGDVKTHAPAVALTAALAASANPATAFALEQ